MKVIGLNGKEYIWKLKCKKTKVVASKWHKLAKDVLTTVYGLDSILQEVACPGSGKLRLDFFLPLRKLAIEVQGEQHYKFLEK